MSDMMATKTSERNLDVMLEHSVPALPPLSVQADRLTATGVLEGACSKLNAEELRVAVSELERRSAVGALLVVPEQVLPLGMLVPHMRRTVSGQEKSGFVVVDMQDLEDFSPTVNAPVPDALVYAIEDPRRGDDMRNWSPAEAQDALSEESRTPFTIAEGVQWALQSPEVVDRNACYMMIGSRRQKLNGFDSRTPALWISNGTGRDGRERRGAPKLGWCWWNNRHTWLGFASGSRRVS